MSMKMRHIVFAMSVVVIGVVFAVVFYFTDTDPGGPPARIFRAVKLSTLACIIAVVWLWWWSHKSTPE